MSTRDVNLYKSFREWFYENVDLESMRTLCRYGASAGIGGLCYCSETTALFNAFKDEIQELATCNYEIELWELARHNDARDITQLINAIVWSAAEKLAGRECDCLDSVEEKGKSLKAAVSAQGDEHDF